MYFSPSFAPPVTYHSKWARTVWPFAPSASATLARSVGVSVVTYGAAVPVAHGTYALAPTWVESWSGTLGVVL